jgi:hypothetical protein
MPQVTYLVDLVTPTLLAASAFFVALSFALLYRYRQISKQVIASNDVGRDLWQALEARLKKQDERILDMMGRVEVIQSRAMQGMLQPPAQVLPAQPEKPSTNVPTGRKRPKGETEAPESAKTPEGVEEPAARPESQPKLQVTAPSQPAGTGSDIGKELDALFVKQDERMNEVMSRLETIQTALADVKERPPPVAPPRAELQAQGRETNTKVDDKVLMQMLGERPQTSVEVRQRFQISREHSSRVLKELLVRGLVTENRAHKPYVYELTEEGRRRLAA